MSKPVSQESHELRFGNRLVEFSPATATAVSKYRDRKFVAVLYPEDPTHAQCIEKLKSGGYNFAACLHDRDVYSDGEHKGETKKAHWHVVMRFKNAVWNTAIAKELGILPNYLEQCREVDGSLLYLVHYGDTNKAQYDYEEVFGPLALRLATLLADTDEGTRALGIVQIVENSNGLLGYSELIKMAVAAGLYADLRRMGAFAVGLLREHNAEVYADMGRAEYGALDAMNLGVQTKEDPYSFARRIKSADKAGLLKPNITQAEADAIRARLEEMGL